jgi:DNA-directed RNA polymerase
MRGLVLLARGKAIGIEGTDELKQYVAACADKWDGAKSRPSTGNRKERIAWTDANLPRLLSVAEAVLNGEAIPKLPKKPVRFLAACLELKQALEIGPSFETRLPLRFDGSNNALQHIAALYRAPEGRYANMSASDIQDDFYRRVANLVYETCADLMEDRDDRDLIKAGCVPWFYGSRAGGDIGFIDEEWIGMSKGIAEILIERHGKSEGAGRLAKAIEKAIKKLAPAAVKLRKLLRRLVRLYHGKNQSLRWFTPSGFPCVNAYHIADKVRVWSQTGKNRNLRHSFTIIIGDTDELDLEAAQRAVAANFVHSLDAAHLHRVVVAAAKADIHLLTVHDCFACLAPDAAKLNFIIRDEFVKMYEQHDPLREILAQARRKFPRAKLVKNPRRGNLDITEIRNSFFFFAS